MAKKTRFLGQTVLFLTELFGKKYYWMQDGDGVVYLVKTKYEPRLDGPGSEFPGGLVPDYS